MTAIAADSYDLRRWVLSAAVVIGLHAALVVRLTTWHEPSPAMKAPRRSSWTLRL